MRITPFPYLIHVWIVLAAAAAGGSLICAFVLIVIGSEPSLISTRDLPSEDRVALRSYAAGMRFFHEGRLRDALISFEAAQTGSAPVLISAANNAVQRSQRALGLPSWFRGPVLRLAEQPLLFQWLLMGSGIVSALLFSSIWLRRFPTEAGLRYREYSSVAE
jgi:hypothetical protein